MKVLVRPCADQPADDDRTGKNQGDLDARFSFDNGIDAARTLRARVGIREWAVEGHPLVVIHDVREARDVEDALRVTARSYTDR